MLKVIIQQNGRSMAEATGTVQELLMDIAVIVNAIHTQLFNDDPAEAEMFQTGLINVISNKENAVWRPRPEMIGFIFPEEK